MEKVLKLNRKLQLELGDARSRICNCEEHIEIAYRASKGINISSKLDDQWDLAWKELTANENAYFFDKKGNMIGSPVCGTVKLKRNKSMIKYLEFFHGELLRVLNKGFLESMQNT